MKYGRNYAHLQCWNSFEWYAIACVCVSVCLREREREWSYALLITSYWSFSHNGVLHCDMMIVSLSLTDQTKVCVCVCVCRQTKATLSNGGVKPNLIVHSFVSHHHLENKRENNFVKETKNTDFSTLLFNLFFKINCWSLILVRRSKLFGTNILQF